MMKTTTKSINEAREYPINEFYCGDCSIRNEQYEGRSICYACVEMYKRFSPYVEVN